MTNGGVDHTHCFAQSRVKHGEKEQADREILWKAGFKHEGKNRGDYEVNKAARYARSQGQDKKDQNGKNMHVVRYVFLYTAFCAAGCAVLCACGRNTASTGNVAWHICTRQVHEERM